MERILWCYGNDIQKLYIGKTQLFVEIRPGRLLYDGRNPACISRMEKYRLTIDNVGATMASNLKGKEEVHMLIYCNGKILYIGGRLAPLVSAG